MPFEIVDKVIHIPSTAWSALLFLIWSLLRVSHGDIVRQNWFLGSSFLFSEEEQLRTEWVYLEQIG